MAQVELLKIAQGLDPQQARKEQKLRTITLSELYDDYLSVKKDLKPNTIHDYERAKSYAFSDWLDQPITSITEKTVLDRHKILGQRSQARANSSMRILRALFNFAGNRYKNEEGKRLFPENPVQILTLLKAWYKINRRTTIIKEHQLKDFLEAVHNLNSSRHRNGRDYLLLLLFTGLRKDEVCSLREENVDIQAKTITLLDPKNREQHIVPLNTVAQAIVVNRYDRIEGDYLFPGLGSSKYYNHPRPAIEAVEKTTGIYFCSHDLRRTFITLAESLDISHYAWKRLVNHKISNNDVSGGYVIPNLERLRRASQMVCDHILHICGQKDYYIISET